MKEIDIEGYKKLAPGSHTLVDTREDSEWQAGHVAGAVHLSKGIIERDIETKFPGQVDADGPVLRRRVPQCAGRGCSAEDGLHGCHVARRRLARAAGSGRPDREVVGGGREKGTEEKREKETREARARSVVRAEHDQVRAPFSPFVITTTPIFLGIDAAARAVEPVVVASAADQVALRHVHDLPAERPIARDHVLGLHLRACSISLQLALFRCTESAGLGRITSIRNFGIVGGCGRAALRPSRSARRPLRWTSSAPSAGPWYRADAPCASRSDRSDT